MIPTAAVILAACPGGSGRPVQRLRRRDEGGGCRGGRAQWQDDGEAAALAYRALDLDRAAHGLAEVMGDGEVEAGPAIAAVRSVAGSGEGFEQGRQHLGVDAGTGIEDTDRERGIVADHLSLAANGERAPSRMLGGIL